MIHIKPYKRLKIMRIKYPSVLFYLSLVILLGLSSCSGSRDYVRVKSSRKSKTKPTYTKVEENKVNSDSYDSRIKLTDFASKFIRTPYRYGGKDPSGFDCSGFTSFVYSNYGYSVRGSSRDQARLGDKLSIRNVDIGDLMFFGSNNKVTHVAMVYEVNGSDIKIIHATSSRGVTITHYTDSDYWIERFLFARDVVSDQYKDLAFN